MKKWSSFLLVILFLLQETPGYGVPLDNGSKEIKQALNYLKSCQLDDGGFGPGGITEWVVMAIAAAGQDPREWRQNGRTLLDYLKKQAVTDNPYDWIRMALALTAIGEDPRGFNEQDYVTRIKNHFNGGQIGDPLSLRDDYWAVLALTAAGEGGSKEVRDSVRFILEHQNTDGSWSASTTGIETCADNTAAAIIALISAGQDKGSEAIIKALEYLKRSQQSDGGFSYLFMPSNAASDCWAIMAVWAAGRDPADWRSNGNDLMSHLLGLQQQEGSFQWASSLTNSPLLMTAYALPALMGKPYPIAPSKSSQVTVSLRIEGESENLLSTQVTIGPSKISDKKGRLHPSPFPTPLSAVVAAAKKTGIEHNLEQSGETLYLTRLGNESNGWQYRVNDILPMIPAHDYQLKSGDEVIWFYDYNGCKSPLRILPDRHEVWKGEEIGFRVEQFSDADNRWHPASDAKVVLNKSSYASTGGRATIAFKEKGSHLVCAEKACAIRSLKKIITIGEKTPAKVWLRVEDNDRLLWKGHVSFCDLDAEDVLGRRRTIQRPVLIGALEAAAKQGTLNYKMIQTAEGLILVSVNDLPEDNQGGSWWYQVNGKNIFEDVDEYVLTDGDEVVFYRSQDPKGAEKTSIR
jgi:hypothetical protein